MNRLFSLSLTLLAGICVAALTGCANNVIFPDVETPQPQVSLGTVKGSNYGGHAPIVGAHVFVLQAGTSGYGGTATSLLSATYSPTYGYPTAQDTTAGSFTNGMYYITTDHAGDFNITGDYTCTAGLPVYVYASGGTSALEPNTAISAGTVGASTATFTANNLFSVGQYVTFGSFLSTAGIGLNTSVNSDAASGVNNNTNSYLVTAANLTSFTVSGSGTFLLQGATGAGYAYPTLPSNPAIVNMAMLGVCSSSGNFSNLSYVYLNEVSTVAMAYSMAGFFSNSATSLVSTDAVHMSIPLESGNSTSSPAWVGIQNAANNAAQLYNIEGKGATSTAGDGEGHIANAKTPSGGTVPQALINAIANALAGCVDSGNTATTATAPCTTLFASALPSTAAAGLPTGTAPKDTATAAINIAHNPWTSKASIILGLSGTVVPYLPTVSSASDLTVGISFPMTYQSGKFSGVAIDQGGNAWLTSFTAGALTKMSPTGTVLSTYVFPFDSQGQRETPGDVAIDSNGRAWVAIRNLDASNAGGPYYDGAWLFTAAGAVVSGSPFGTTGGAGSALADDITVAIDANDNAYFGNHTSDNAVLLGPTGQADNSFSNATYTNDGPFGVVLDKNDDLWMTTNITTNNVTKFLTLQSNTNPAISIAVPDPEGVAIDASGNVWVANSGPTSSGTHSTSLYEIKSGGGTAVYSSAGLYDPVGVAVDGSGLVFVSTPNGPTNDGDIAVFSNSGTALTGSNGFTGTFVSGGNTIESLNGPYFIAVDNSGDLWTSTNTTTVEYIGVATPVLTPLSAAVKKGTIAARP